MMRSDFMERSLEYPTPSRSATPGAKFSITTSEREMSACASSTALGFFMSRVALRT